MTTHHVRRPRRSRGSHDAAAFAAGRSKERVGAMTRVMGIAMFVGGMLASVPAAAAPVAAIGDGRGARTVDVAECKARFNFRGRTVTGCTTLGSPDNRPWCELANPPVNRSLPAWAFCRAPVNSGGRPRTGRAAGTAPPRTATSTSGTALRDGRSGGFGVGGNAAGGSGNPSDIDDGREASDGETGTFETENAEDDGGAGDDGGSSSEGGDDGSFDDEDAAGDDGSFDEDADGLDSEGGDDGSFDEDADGLDSEDGDEGDAADAGNDDGSEIPDPATGDGTLPPPIPDGSDPAAIPPPITDGSDPAATPNPTEVPPTPPGTDPLLPTPTDVSPPGSPATDGDTGGNEPGAAPQDGLSGLSPAAIASIVVGVVAAALLLIVLPMYVKRKKSAGPEEKDAAAAAAAAGSDRTPEEFGNVAPARAPRPVPLAVDNVRSTFASTYRSTASSTPRSNRSSVSSRTTSQYGPDPSTISFSEAPLGRWTVATMYAPTLSDELVVDPGDIVDVYKKFDDGWVTAVNVSKGFARGVMPMHCLDMDQGQLSPELIDEQGVEMFQ